MPAQRISVRGTSKLPKTCDGNLLWNAVEILRLLKGPSFMYERGPRAMRAIQRMCGDHGDLSKAGKMEDVPSGHC